jgi:hypothetical protein
VRSTTKTICLLSILLAVFCVRGRIPGAKQAKGQRKNRGVATQNRAGTFPATSAIGCVSGSYAVLP